MPDRSEREPALEQHAWLSSWVSLKGAATLGEPGFLSARRCHLAIGFGAPGWCRPL
jgi:hypothetical protein